MNNLVTIAFLIAAPLVVTLVLTVWLKTMAKRREASQAFIDHYNMQKEDWRPLFSEWIVTRCGEYFRKASIVAMTKNPNGTMNVIFGNGHSINTVLQEDEITLVLGIHADRIETLLSKKRKEQEL
jgi:hypothetical protein